MYSYSLLNPYDFLTSCVSSVLNNFIFIIYIQNTIIKLFCIVYDYWTEQETVVSLLFFIAEFIVELFDGINLSYS